MGKQLKETFNYSAEDARYINVKESSTPTLMLRVGAEKISRKLVFFCSVCTIFANDNGEN